MSLRYNVLDTRLPTLLMLRSHGIMPLSIDKDVRAVSPKSLLETETRVVHLGLKYSTEPNIVPTAYQAADDLVHVPEMSNLISHSISESDSPE